MKARDSFAKTIENKVKCAAGLNMHGERIQLIDKNSKHADCPTCNIEESWKHVTLCDKNKQIRDKWLKSTKAKFKEIIKKRKVTDCEKKIVEEIEKDIGKYFNNEENACTN